MVSQARDAKLAEKGKKPQENQDVMDLELEKDLDETDLQRQKALDDLQLRLAKMKLELAKTKPMAHSHMHTKPAPIANLEDEIAVLKDQVADEQGRAETLEKEVATLKNQLADKKHEQETAAIGKKPMAEELKAGSVEDDDHICDLLDHLVVVAVMQQATAAALNAKGPLERQVFVGFVHEQRLSAPKYRHLSGHNALTLEMQKTMRKLRALMSRNAVFIRVEQAKAALDQITTTSQGANFNGIVNQVKTRLDQIANDAQASTGTNVETTGPIPSGNGRSGLSGSAAGGAYYGPFPGPFPGPIPRLSFGNEAETEDGPERSGTGLSGSTAGRGSYGSGFSPFSNGNEGAFGGSNIADPQPKSSMPISQRDSKCGCESGSGCVLDTGVGCPFGGRYGNGSTTSNITGFQPRTLQPTQAHGSGSLSGSTAGNPFGNGSGNEFGHSGSQSMALQPTQQRGPGSLYGSIANGSGNGFGHSGPHPTALYPPEQRSSGTLSGNQGSFGFFNSAYRPYDKPHDGQVAELSSKLAAAEEHIKSMADQLIEQQKRLHAIQYTQGFRRELRDSRRKAAENSN